MDSAIILGSKILADKKGNKYQEDALFVVGKAEFYKKVTDKDASQAKALWSKLVFTGKASMPKEVPNSAAVKNAVAANPKAIGYMEKSAVDGSVKVVYTAQ